MKKNAFLSLLAILLVFGMTVVGCDNGTGGRGGSAGGDKTTTYSVTIGTLSNGTITANPTSGVAGTEITLTITPDSDYRLKAGTLKFGTNVINETSFKFILPAENVTVTGEFESILNGTWLFPNNIPGWDWGFIFNNGFWKEMWWSQEEEMFYDGTARGTFETNGDMLYFTATHVQNLRAFIEGDFTPPMEEGWHTEDVVREFFTPILTNEQLEHLIESWFLRLLSSGTWSVDDDQLTITWSNFGNPNKFYRY